MILIRSSRFPVHTHYRIGTYLDEYVPTLILFARYFKLMSLLTYNDDQS